MDEQTARREIVRVGRLMYERSYVVSSDGNVSVRLDDGRIVATPTQTCKGRMTEEMLAVTDLEGKALDDRRVSSELAMHPPISREREERGGARNLPPDSIEKLIEVRERAGYLDERARCQSCGYLHETQVVCPTGERADAARTGANGAGKIALTREELIELLCQAARVGQ